MTENKKDRKLFYGLLDFSKVLSSMDGAVFFFDKVYPDLSFLDIFLSRVQKIKQVDKFIAVIASEHEKLVRPQVEKYLDSPMIAILPEGEKVATFYLGHKRVSRSRKWAYQTLRGGVMESSIYDEIMPMELIKDFDAQVQAEGIVHLHPEFPLFEPGYVDDSILSLNQDGEAEVMPLLLRQAPIGVSPALITSRGLNLLEEMNWSPLHVFKSNSANDGMMKMRHVVFHNLEEDVSRGNFVLRTKRDSEHLKSLLHKIGEKGLEWKLADFIKVSREHPEIFEQTLPKEIDIEVTSVSYPTDCRLPSLCEEKEMPLELLQKILADIAQYEDILVSIGDLGDILTYSDLPGLRAAIRSNQTYGVHLNLNAESLLKSEESAEEWFKLPVDIISIRLTSLSYSSEHSLSDFEKLLERLAKFSNKKKSHPILHLEIHKHESNWRDFHLVNKWAEQYNVSFNWVPYSDYAEQMPQAEKEILYTPKPRYPCEKMLFQAYVHPDGEVSLCKMDYKKKYSYGSLKEKSISEIWNHPELKDFRSRQIKGNFETTELCKNCKNWMHN